MGACCFSENLSGRFCPASVARSCTVAPGRGLQTGAYIRDAATLARAHYAFCRVSTRAWHASGPYEPRTRSSFPFPLQRRPVAIAEAQFELRASSLSLLLWVDKHACAAVPVLVLVHLTGGRHGASHATRTATAKLDSLTPEEAERTIRSGLYPLGFSLSGTSRFGFFVLGIS